MTKLIIVMDVLQILFSLAVIFIGTLLVLTGEGSWGGVFVKVVILAQVFILVGSVVDIVKECWYLD